MKISKVSNYIIFLLLNCVLQTAIAQYDPNAREREDFLRPLQSVAGFKNSLRMSYKYSPPLDSFLCIDHFEKNGGKQFDLLLNISEKNGLPPPDKNLCLFHAGDEITSGLKTTREFSFQFFVDQASFFKYANDGVLTNNRTLVAKSVAGKIGYLVILSGPNNKPIPNTCITYEGKVVKLNECKPLI